MSASSAGDILSQCKAGISAGFDFHYPKYDQQSKFSPNQQKPVIYIGLSGGKDSVVLLHALWQLSQSVTDLKLEAQLHVIHINHHLHDKADESEVYCQQLCNKLSIKLTCVSVFVTIDKQQSKGIESAAREQRYRAFQEVISSQSNSDLPSMLLLAHHQNDQAETVMLNLFRGSGLTGLAGMRRANSFSFNDNSSSPPLKLCRPLLSVNQGEIQNYALANDLSWIEDPTNSDTSLRRNFLRREVLPVIESKLPQVVSSIAKSADLQGESDQILNEISESWFQQDIKSTGSKNRKKRSIDLFRLTAESLPMQCQLIRYWLKTLDWSMPNRLRLQEFVNQIQEKTRSSMAKMSYLDVHANREREIIAESGKLWALPNKKILSEVVDINLIEIFKETGLAAIDWVIGELTINNESLDIENVLVELKLRKLSDSSVSMSDKYKPISRLHSQKLKVLCQESDIPAWMRPHLPVLWVDDQIAWIGAIDWVLPANNATKKTDKLFNERGVDSNSSLVESLRQNINLSWQL